MAPYVRVFNVSTKRYVKPGQAQGWVDDGVCEWVEQGLTIRMLTLAEMAARRSELSSKGKHEYFPPAELPRVEMRGIEGVRRELNTAWQGTLFAVPTRADELVAWQGMHLAGGGQPIAGERL